MTSAVWAEPLELGGLLAVRGWRHSDHRGVLRKVVTRGLLAEIGRDLRVDEVLVSHNPSPGTLRGMHVQLPPHDETKVLWVTSGALFDVLVDTREDSPTCGRWIGVALDAREDTALVVPPGLAHGYLTLEPDTTVVYLIEGAHEPAAARTLRWDDARVAIEWPQQPTTMSDADRNAPGWPVS